MKRNDGLTWALRSDDGRLIIIAVINRTVIWSTNGDQWPAALYMNDEAAQEGALNLTKQHERNGMHLIAGPTQFAPTNPEHKDTLSRNILLALAIEHPGAPQPTTT